MPPLEPMAALQNSWYNGLCAALSADPSSFQILVPSPWLALGDGTLWSYEDLLPPDSLTFNARVDAGSHFFDAYAAVIGQLEFPQSAFERDIGPDVAQAWAAYVSQVRPPPGVNDLPPLFRDWSLRHAPATAARGTADLATMALIASARGRLAPHEGARAAPADFNGTLADLRQLLQQSGAIRIDFSRGEASDDVSGTWTRGADSVAWGLQPGDDATSPVSRTFASSEIEVAASFASWTVWRSVPGGWYDSSLLNLAFSNRSSPPWAARASPSWDDAFGPRGSLQRLIASLVVVDGMRVTVTSDAMFSVADQQTIREGEAGGFWPFYIPDRGSAIKNSVTFDRHRGMRIQTMTESQNPFAIGTNVLAIARYLGHG